MPDDSEAPMPDNTTFRTFIADEFKAITSKIDAQGLTLKEQDEVLKKQDVLLESMAASAEKSAEAHTKMVALVQQALDISADDALIKHDIANLKKDVSDCDFQIARILKHVKLKKASTD